MGGFQARHEHGGLQRLKAADVGMKKKVRE
jgi:hypothetical protein